MSIARNGYRRQQFGKTLVMISRTFNERQIVPVSKKVFNQIAPTVGAAIENLPHDKETSSLDISEIVRPLVPEAVRVNGYLNPTGTAWVEIELPIYRKDER